MAEIEGKDTSDHAQLFERQGLILQMILVLKQVCNHPYQYLKSGRCSVEDSGKVESFITKDSFEEKIDNLIQSKKRLAEMTVASGESWIGKLSNKELRDLFEQD